MSITSIVISVVCLHHLVLTINNLWNIITLAETVKSALLQMNADAVAPITFVMFVIYMMSPEVIVISASVAKPAKRYSVVNLINPPPTGGY